MIGAVSIPLLHLVIIRSRGIPERNIVLLPLCFLCSFALCLALIALFTDAETIVTSATFAFSLLAFLCLGYLEMMFKICRGFSHTLITDVARHPGITADGLHERFADGAGMEEMLERRLGTMEGAGLILRDDGRLTLTRKGWTSGRFGLHFKHFLQLGDGG